MTATVGFIGVGNMGNPMASNVLKSGVSMTVFDLHAPAMKTLIAAGAKPARPPHPPRTRARGYRRTKRRFCAGGQLGPYYHR